MSSLLVLVALVSALLSGGGAWWLTSALDERAALKLQQKHDEQVEAANQRAQNAADDWEVWASLQRPKTVAQARKVDDEIKIADTVVDGCSAQPLPAGLRASLEAVASNADPLGAYSLLPGAHPAPVGVLGRAGQGPLGSPPGTP